MRCGIVREVAEWPVAIDRRYHDAVILDLDSVVTATVFTGLETRDDRLTLDPRWPKSLGPIGFAFVYRGQRLHLRISGRARGLTSEAGNTGRVLVECRGRVHHLLPGHTIKVA